MLPKVRAALVKHLKPLPVVEADAPSISGSPSPLTRENDFQRFNEPQSNASEHQAQVIPFPERSSEAAESPPAHRNPIIEFFGKLRANGFPVLKWIAVAAYSIAAKGIKGSKQQKGILVDRDQK